MDRWTALLTAIAGVVGALVYLARLLRRGLRMLDQLSGLPEVTATLERRADENAAGIARLSNEVAWLRAALVSRRAR